MEEDFIALCEGIRDGSIESVPPETLARFDEADQMTIMGIFEDAQAKKAQQISNPDRDQQLRDAMREAAPVRARSRKVAKTRVSWTDIERMIYDCGWLNRYNVISKKYEVTGRTASGRAMTQEDLVVLLHDALGEDFSDCSMDVLTAYSTFIARENQYNPVLEALKNVSWDGKDRLPELYAIIGIEEDDSLSRSLVRKWLLQGIALLFNDPADPFGADGCLVFQGSQGAGKTSLFRHLALKPAWFGEGQSIDDRDKDTTRRVLGVWIAELGEVESTLKSDIAKLKAFVTAAMDQYRLPYGRADIESVRMTSLCATCNSDRYLIDASGNRRWWTVPFKGCSYEQIQALDAWQLWAQIFAEVQPLTYEQQSACFRLSEQEKEELARRNGDFEKPMKGQPEVEDILSQAKPNAWADMTMTEFKERWPSLRQYTVQQLSAVVRHLGIEERRKKNGRMYRLPTHTL